MFEQEAYERLKRRLIVDANVIDDEYIENPSLLHEALEYSARANERKERGESYLKSTRSIVAAELREAPSASGKPRSEAVVTSETETVASVIDARDDLATASLDAQLWLAMVEGMRARGFTLHGLTDMTLAGFTVSGSSRSAAPPAKQREPVAEVLARRKRMA